MHFDTIISGAAIHDGLGHVPYTADLGIAGDRIGDIGDLKAARAGRRIHASGFALCPGFIDSHSHADLTIGRADHPRLLAPLLRQGITTFVGGNCGMALAPLDRIHPEVQEDFYDFILGTNPMRDVAWNSFGEMLSHCESQGMLLNGAFLAPHGVLRILAMGGSRSAATAADLAHMTRGLEECLEGGAIGMSVGLQYFPGTYAETDELIHLARILRGRGIFTAHSRSYNTNTLPQAIDELFQVCRCAEVPTQVSHLFAVPIVPGPLLGPFHAFLRRLSALHGRLPLPLPIDVSIRPAVEAIEKHARDGYPMGLDVMPTSAAFTYLIAFFPPWILGGTRAQVMDRIRDPATRRAMLEDIEHGDLRWPHRGRRSWSLNLCKAMGWDAIQIMSVESPKNQDLLGLSLAEIGKLRGCHPFEAACDLMLEEEGRVLAFETPTHPGDPFIEEAGAAALLSPHASIATDAILLGYGKPSHLFHDCFPRFLGGWSRDRKALPLPEAIRKCTSLPAQHYGIRERGVLAKGNFADLVLFDPDTIGSRSTPMDPARDPRGVSMVFLNGEMVVDDRGVHTDRLKGRVIRR